MRHAKCTIRAMPARWTHTKIVCTLGPATDAPGVLEALIEAGMDVARINLSHGTEEEHARRIHAVREASRRAERPIGVLADLPGPKWRLGAIAGDARELRDRERVRLVAQASTARELPVPHPELLSALRPGVLVYFADGAVRLSVSEAAADHAECEVLAGGVVRSGSGINAPALELPALVPTAQDRRCLAFAASQGVEWIGVSFVQEAADLERVRACLPGGDAPLLMAKIEKRRALVELDAILESADAVMVARGDLGVETELAEIPLVQKRIIAAANDKARPVVTATQMLESMVTHEQPTRAEVSDVANAVLDGTDAVMLSAESAIGRHPALAVRMLKRVIAATDERVRLPAAPLAGGEPIAFAACQLAERLEARAIVVRSRELREVASLARFRPRAPLVALAASERLARSLAVVCGVAPLHAGVPGRQRARDWLAASSLARPGDAAVLARLSPRAGALGALRAVRLR